MLSLEPDHESSLLAYIIIFSILSGEERTGCFALFVFLVSHDCCVALPHDAMGLSSV